MGGEALCTCPGMRGQVLSAHDKYYKETYNTHVHCKLTMVIQTKKNTHNFGINAHNQIMCVYTKVTRGFLVCITIVSLQCVGVSHVV